MRVIETIVKTVPQEEIDPLAEFFTQDWDDGLLAQYRDKPHPRSGWWDGDNYEGSLGKEYVSADASTAVITREELMKAYDLVEQGYTLWFGGDCPVEKGVFVDVIYRNGIVSTNLPANEFYHTQRDASIAFWRNDKHIYDIIAYRLSETEAKPLSLSPLSEEKVKVIQSVIVNNHTKNWSYHPDSILVNKETGKFCSGADSFVIITKDEWNTYLDSVKIEVGDTVSFVHSDVFYEVLYVGKEKAFIKDSDGTEYSFLLEELSKVVK